MFRLALVKKYALLLFQLSFLVVKSSFAQDVRKDILLNEHWKTVSEEKDIQSFAGFEKDSFNDHNWEMVDVPHNWDGYEGYRRLKHGNKHGYAWYRKTFSAAGLAKNKKYFLWFEGVGSYATVWVNGKLVGQHKGGRTSFTLDISEAIKFTGNNLIAVRADHPAMINDLPWLCGGCSEDRGWSEGSQPLGIFRPVHLIVTNPVRIEPFGVHIWNDEKISAEKAVLNLETEVKNYRTASSQVSIVNKLIDAAGKIVFTVRKEISIDGGETKTVQQQSPSIVKPHLWSLEDPYLYKLYTEIYTDGKLTDQIATPYGIRWISWPVGKQSEGKQFLLNGKPVFINGTCEYEHQLGKSHAFSKEQIKARVSQIRAAGFNAFRDAHQPHNLLYQKFWDETGILLWTQFSAHAWYNNDAFKENTKVLLKEWVKERRNSPSVILWGLQNESKLPEDFAKECTEIIRQLDPTASVQRLVTTCNGGEGTDWNVPQNWTGTYGGNPALYGEDLKRQILVGEYGAWRSLDLHTEGAFQQNGAYSEDRMTQLMELKIRLADSVKDEVAGHFHWLFNSHDNPGRTQGGEGFRELDRIGPVNYKGLFTPWGEPTDAYYLFRSNYAPKETAPMLYIVSHTWPDRWTKAGQKDGVVVYSNCDEVELFNDVRTLSLGTRKQKGRGTHFQWDSVNILFNVLYAEGRINGKTVVTDIIQLNHLPKAPGLSVLAQQSPSILAPVKNYNYLYRVNCGGAVFTDSHGNLWMADRAKAKQGTWGSLSWTKEFKGMPDYFASQRTTSDWISGTNDGTLFQSFRYGREKLSYEFPVADGEYLVELYFVEPWYGRGGGLDCTGWRLFDVAMNNQAVLKNLDVWKEVGYNKALKKTVKAKVSGGVLKISFPRVDAGQALIAAIAIASVDKKIKPAAASPLLINEKSLVLKNKGWRVQTWLTTGVPQYSDAATCFSALPPELYGAEWISTPSKRGSVANSDQSFVLNRAADVYIALDNKVSSKPNWMHEYADAKKELASVDTGLHYFHLYTKRFEKGSPITLGDNYDSASMYSVFVLPVTAMEPAYDLKPTTKYEAETAILKNAVEVATPYKERKYVTMEQKGGSVTWPVYVGVADKYAIRFKYINRSGRVISMHMKLLAVDGTVLKEEIIEFAPTTEKWAVLDNSTGSMINAGDYRIVLSSDKANELGIDGIEVQ